MKIAKKNVRRKSGMETRDLSIHLFILSKVNKSVKNWFIATEKIIKINPTFGWSRGLNKSIPFATTK